jgi:hypothetical protein
MKSDTDVMQRVAAANPIPGGFGSDAASEALLGSILSTQPGTGDDRRQHVLRNGTVRAAAIVAAALVAIAVPTLALADHFGVLGLTNAGEPVSRASVDPYELRALETYGGSADGMRRLGVRAGVAFYIGRSERGGLCFAAGSAEGSAPRLNHFIGCQADTPDAFPSPQRPIFSLSAFKTTPLPRQVTYILRLAGFAADGVARVGYIDTKGVTHTTPVVDNIYGLDLSHKDVAATAVVAFDTEGRELYKVLLPPRHTSSPGG